MSLSDIVSVTFSLQNPGVTVAGFGVPLIASPNATWSERTRTYSDITGVSSDWAVTTPEYMAASVMFSQDTGLSKLMIGRCANAPTQRFSIEVLAVTLNAKYRVRVSGPSGSAWVDQEADYTASGAAAWAINTVYTQGQLVVNDSAPLKFYICITGGTSAGAGGPTGTNADITDNTVHWMYAGTGVLATTTNDAIVYNLKLLIDAFATPALAVTTSLQGSVGAKTLRILANTAGAFFGAEVLDFDSQLLELFQDHADPGIAADLTALKRASSAWYGLVTLFNSSALVLAAAAWVEANTKLYIAGLLDSDVANDADSGASDVAHQLKAASYARTGPFFHPNNDDFADAAEIARWFPIDPGGDDWRLKVLAGVTIKAYTDTQVVNLTAKYCNYYADLVGANVVQGEGKVSANEYIDVIRFRDWYSARLQERGVNLLIDVEKEPFDDSGIAKFETIIKALNEEGITAGGIAKDPAPVVIVPLASSVITADKQARWLKGVKSTWELAGAIHKLSVTVQASA